MIPEDFRPIILRFEKVDSTNAKAKELAVQGAAEGTVVVAEHQENGRGRGNRKWHSPTGGLYASILLFPRNQKHATDLALLSGVAISQAIRQVLPKSIDVSVKWPNDVLINWKKVSGVLCEALGDPALGLCVVGIGINVNTAKEELTAFNETAFGATSMSAESAGGRYETETVLKVLLAKLFALYRLYHSEGLEPIRYLWEKNCAFIGRRVELSETGMREAIKDRVGVTVGTFLGIDDSGGIVLSNAKGERRSYHSGVITCCLP